MPDYSRLLIRLLRTALAEVHRTPSEGDDSADGPPSAPEGNSASARRSPRSVESDSSTSSPPDFRRPIAGMVAALMLTAAAIASATPWLTNWTGSQSTSDFLISALTRIGLVIGAIWLAWDSMRRPARWIPPGLAVAGVVGIIVIAAQPKLIFAIVPLLGGLAVLTSIVRAVRRR